MLSFTFYSCQKDEFIEESGIESHSEKNLKFEFKNKTFAELTKETKFKKAYQKFIDKKVGNSNFEGRTIMEDQYGFTIDSSLVKEFSSELYTSYTFFITRDSLHNDYFENLVVEIDSSNTVTAVIVKYFLNSPNITYPEHKSFYLDANAVEITPINFNNDLSKVSALGDCIGIWMCPWQDDHPATNVCVEENRGDLWLDTSMCDDSVGSSNESSSNNGESSSSGGGSTGGGSGTPPTNDYDGSDPDIHGNGGGVTTSPNTGCEGNCFEEVIVGTPCENITRQTNTASYKQRFKNLNTPENINANQESGFYQNLVNGKKRFFDGVPVGNQHLQIPEGSLNATHVHNKKPMVSATGINFDGSSKIPSPEDVAQLVTKCHDANSTNPENAFVITVTDQGIFAVTLLESISQSEEIAITQNWREFKKNYYDLSIGIKTEYSTPESRSDALQYMLLKQLKKVGLGDKVALFKATIENESDPDINNYNIKWSRITLGGNLFNPLDETPCP
ncbi:hypothetical protein ACFQ3R_12005 [Mesonia ostreae]|uniref:Uncharacterized protein n=1 Tax=Mesonia ostreae TaxID=861110 RepID=A0ABU2KIF1_9FLAO|nr:hypothetical protein [Mesonia ostreae]MDT0294491.1 hypothetical protein [Mesonia ostreae]